MPLFEMQPGELAPVPSFTFADEKVLERSGLQQCGRAVNSYLGRHGLDDRALSWSRRQTMTPALLKPHRGGLHFSLVVCSVPPSFFFGCKSG